MLAGLHQFATDRQRQYRLSLQSPRLSSALQDFAKSSLVALTLATNTTAKTKTFIEGMKHGAHRMPRLWYSFAGN
ncbi:MAG TPA: hypothetical protein DEF45_08380 [Rhodopirellula sp.]|nr:hypothetical protein [Rhodopirellula sp.]